MMIRLLLVWCISVLLIACGDRDSSHVATAPPKLPIRYGMITGLKPDMMGKYKDLHQHPWPAVLKKIKECHIQNYSIFLKEIDNKQYLFSYFEYTGEDFGGDMKKMTADTATQRWWKETDPCQLPLKEALEKHEIWTGMEEVFHM